MLYSDLKAKALARIRSKTSISYSHNPLRGLEEGVMLILEVTGTFDPQAIQSLLKSDERIEHFPYAVLGDFSLRIHMDKDTVRAAELLQGLEKQGYGVIGYRWKREVPATPSAPRVSVNVEPVHAPEPWYARLFPARKRTATN